MGTTQSLERRLSTTLSTLSLATGLHPDPASTQLPAPPASARRASIQQPLAATLPPKLLFLMFEEVHQLLGHHFAQQRERIAQGSVCEAWYAARLRRDELAVEGDRRARALAHTLRADPARAAAITKLTAANTGLCISTLLELCEGLICVVLADTAPVIAEALPSLPPSTRTLILSVRPGEGEQVPELYSVPSTASTQLQWMWDSSRSPPTAAVLDALKPVLAQITHLDLRDEDAAEDEESVGCLESLLPLAPYLSYVETNLWQVRPSELANVVRQLGALEQLQLANLDLDDHLAPALAAELVRAAPDSLRTVWIDELLVDERGPQARAWTVAERAGLEQLAVTRAIELIIGDSQLSHGFS